MDLFMSEIFVVPCKNNKLFVSRLTVLGLCYIISITMRKI